jgi:hypothetical protein
MEVSSQLQATTTLPSGEVLSVLIVKGAADLRASLNEMKTWYRYFRKKTGKGKAVPVLN